ncbi:NAD(P)-dependent oxidoreductase [Microbacterium sp. ZW T5_45]|uniref:NAD(P)-dependent oxidoreductase n=1 Tax=Microbacterium sp. ZW T5_45 TaxID=3378080 RepID=UPI0038545A11
MTRSSIAFIGLGAIGLPMALSIVRAGFDVTGIEPAEAGRERAADAGIRAVPTLAEVAPADVVVVMVATADQLDSVVDAAIEADAAAGATWIIMSTVGPDAVRAQGRRLADAGASVVDAPVSGGIARASRGDLALFVSGSEGDLARVDDVLQAMGAPRVVGTEVGDGQSVKVVNQHLCAVHIAAAAEALALAESLGLDPEFVLDVVGQGAAASFMLGDRGPRMLQSPDAPVLSQIGIFVKDTGLVADAGAAASAELPILTAARERFLQADASGLRTHDDSSVIETYRNRSAS